MPTNPMVNPIDAIFDFQQENDEHKYQQVTEGELAEMAEVPQPPEKDQDDVEIDKKIDTIYDSALDAYNTQTAYTEIIEPRYAARNAEVAAQYLNIALNAAATRARVKGDRKRNSQFVPYAAGAKTGGVVVASREEIMRLISVDAEVKKI